MLPHVASAAFAWPLEAQRIVGRLVGAQHRSDGHVGSRFDRLDAESLKTWLKDYSPGELWEKNVIGGGPH